MFLLAMSYNPSLVLMGLEEDEDFCLDVANDTEEEDKAEDEDY